MRYTGIEGLVNSLVHSFLIQKLSAPTEFVKSFIVLTTFAVIVLSTTIVGVSVASGSEFRFADFHSMNSLSTQLQNGYETESTFGAISNGEENYS